jgi:hypothetical protein
MTSPPALWPLTPNCWVWPLTPSFGHGLGGDTFPCAGSLKATERVVCDSGASALSCCLSHISRSLSSHALRPRALVLISVTFFCDALAEMVTRYPQVFLVLQKKPVIFLHWFHHVTVLLYCWLVSSTHFANQYRIVLSVGFGTGYQAIVRVPPALACRFYLTSAVNPVLVLHCPSPIDPPFIHPQLCGGCHGVQTLLCPLVITSFLRFRCVWFAPRLGHSRSEQRRARTFTGPGRPAPRRVVFICCPRRRRLADSRTMRANHAIIDPIFIPPFRRGAAGTHLQCGLQPGFGSSR